MFRVVIISIVVLMMVGCANSPFQLSMMSPEELQQVETSILCKHYGHDKGSVKTRAELVRRNIFTEKEWELIDNSRVQIGMSELALLGSWGSARKVNKSVGSWGVNKQWIYYKRNVYTKNGKVTSWQVR